MTKSTFTIAVAALLISSEATAEDLYFISFEGYECIRENIDRYVSQPQDPIIIYPQVCPQLKLSASDINSRAINTLPKIQLADEGSTFDEALIFSKSDLECLKSISPSNSKLEISSSFVRVPKEPCKSY